MKLRSALVVVTLAVFGCASAPKISYHTLDLEPSGRIESGDNLVVERFQTTEALGRAQIMVSSSPTEIEYYAVDQWVGGVGEMVQRKLSEEFGPGRDGRRTLIVSGKVLSFEQVDRPDGTAARVKLHVAVRDAEKKRYDDPVLEKTYAMIRPVSGPVPSGVVQELSRCMEDVAVEIVADLKNHP